MPAARDREPAAGAPTCAAVRRLLVVAAVLVFLAGVQLFVFPLRTDEWFAWTVASPMTAVFLGASYFSAIPLELASARAGRWADARIALPAVFAFTSLTFLVTVLHLDLFHLGSEHAASTRAVTWAWIGVYAAVPVMMVVAAVRQRALSTEVGPAEGLPLPVRAVLLLLAVVLLATGAALLVDPTWVAGGWPWPLTPLTGRAVGAWAAGLGTGAAHALVVDDRRGVRPLALTGVAFGALQGVALLRHGDELDWGSPAAWAYVTVLVALTGVSAWALWPSGSPAVARRAAIDPSSVVARNPGDSSRRSTIRR